MESQTLFTSTCTLQDVDQDVALVAVVDGPDKGMEVPFASRMITVGKGQGAGMRLTDPGVSRLHCELIREGGNVRIRDLGSKNGCWLAGCRIDDGVLTAGARVRLGSTTIEARIDRRRLRKAIWQGGERFGPILGTSVRMQDLFTQMAKVADSEASALILGESGTGKEEVARALHQAGRRKDGPFVVVDGAAMSASLADLELFGHARGAFTGAEIERSGAFERAHGGTIFLDEVGELPLDLQPKLLRALDDRTVQRLGEGQRRAVDVRVLAATHRSLARMVNEGTFREDLYYRLAVVELEVPPLRERGEDVKRIARHFLEHMAPGDAAAADALEKSLAKQAGYRWPGNVRELRSFVRRCIVLGEGSLGAPKLGSDSPDTIRPDLPFSESKALWIGQFEREYLARLLDETGGNLTEASRRSGLARSRMHELVKKHGLRK